MILLLFAFDLGAATNYIAVTGSNSTGDGSSGNPWATPQKAFDSMADGDTLIQRAGTYTNYSTYNRIYLNRCTFIGEAGSTNLGSGWYICGTNNTFLNIVVADVELGYQFAGAFILETNSHYSFFSGCQVLGTTIGFTNDTSSGRYGWIWNYVGRPTNGTYVVRPEWCASNCTITNCVIDGLFDGQCFHTQGTNNLIVNNRFLNGSSSDIFWLHGARNICRGNYATNFILLSGPYFHPDMLQTGGFQQFTAADSPANPYFDSYGHIIERNQFWTCRIAVGQLNQDYTNVGFIYVGGWTIRNNLWVDSGSESGSVSSIDIPDLIVANNTFVRCGTAAGAATEVLAFIVNTNSENAGGYLKPDWRGAGTNATLINNAFIACGKDANGGWYSFSVPNNYTTNIINPHTSGNFAVHWTGSAWAAKNSTVQLGVSDMDTYIYPVQVNPGTDPKLVAWALSNSWSNYRPIVGSPLIDAGADASSYVTSDFENISARPLGSGWDIGCFEFDPALLVNFDYDEYAAGSNRVYDVTGYGYDAVKMDPTNFFQKVTSRNGTTATYGAIVSQVPDANYNYSWYGAITNLNNGTNRIDFITNGTFASWARMETNGERYDTILCAGDVPSSAITPTSATNGWTVVYGFQDLSLPVTNFVFKNFGLTTTAGLHSPGWEFGWPAQPRDGVTWAHLAATWSTNGAGSMVVTLYFNGSPWTTNTVSNVPWLRVDSSPAEPWMALNIQTHGGTPQWADSDIYPNYGALKGSLDDTRIYARALSGSEVANLYAGGGPAVTSGGGSSPAAPFSGGGTATATTMSAQNTFVGH